MKLQLNNNNYLSFKQRSHGYASVAMVAAIAVTSLLGLMAVFRQGMRSHEAQARNQVKIDYRQKEDALLRALVAIVPNKAVGAMMPGSAGDASVRWDAIFTQAIAASNAETAMDSAIVSGFGIANLVGANTGDMSTLLPSSFVGVVDGAGTLVGPGNIANTDLHTNPLVLGKLPPPMAYSGPLANDLLAPIISTGKTYPTTTPGLGASATEYPLYNLIPYPDIRLGFAAQGQNFIAKRNWWAFSLTFGNGVSLTNNTGTAATAIPTVTKNYVLSIYEVPAQSAVSAGGGTLQLGTYAGGGAWTGTTITGNAYGAEVRGGGAVLAGNSTISARNTVSGSATVSGQGVSGGADALGTRESRWASSGSDFYGMSDAGSSGRVAILPISQGDQFLRVDGSTAALGSGSLSPTGWFEYAMGARQCRMMIEIIRCSTAGGQANKPIGIRFHYIDSAGLPAVETLIMPPPRLPGDPVPIYSAGNQVWENHDRDLWVNPDGSSDPSVIPFYWENLTNNGASAAAASDPCLTIKMERLQAYLAVLGAGGVDGSPGNPNNSLAIWSNTTGLGVNQPTIPAVAGEMGVVVRAADDLSAYLKGFSLVTDHRVYLAGDINQVQIPLPAGSGLPGGTIHYPPVSVFAGEKRFGTSDTSVSSITIAGQVSSMADDTGTVVNPLDLQVGTGTTGANTGTISADLEQVLSPAQLPPVSKMTWIVTIEEVHQ